MVEELENEGGEEAVSVRFLPDNSQPAPRFYSNLCVVRHTPYDFNIEFCEVPALHEDEQEALAKAPEKIIRAPVRVEVILPSGIIPAVIDALHRNYEKFCEHYAEAEEESQDSDA